MLRELELSPTHCLSLSQGFQICTEAMSTPISRVLDTRACVRLGALITSNLKYGTRNEMKHGREQGPGPGLGNIAFPPTL